MIILLDKTTYKAEDYSITVVGVNADQLSLLIPICSEMDRKVKAKLLEVAKDEELSEALARMNNGEELSKSDLIKISQFGNDSNDPKDNFSLNECKELLDAYEECILNVVDKDGNEVRDEYLDAVRQSPKHLKMMGNLIYQEYKSAVQLPDLKKI